MEGIVNELIKYFLEEASHPTIDIPENYVNKREFLKGLLNVGDEIVETIIANRPYESPKDFLRKVKPNKQAMISLIKSGAFDKMADRKFVLAWYIYETCDKKSVVNLRNMNGLLTQDLLPTHDDFEFPYKVYEFNRYLKAKCKTALDINNYYFAQ